MLGNQFETLPFYQQHTDDKYLKKHNSLFNTIQRYIIQIYKQQETRKVVYFLLLNIAFTLVEFVYGYITNSLGLTADAVHMLFDNTAIICSLFATVVAKWDSSSTFTFGYSRVETLTGFINALALVFASGNIIWEAIERLFFPEELKSGSLLMVSFLGLLVNLVGIFAFDHGGTHGHAHHGHSHGDHSHGHDHGSHSHDHSSHDHVHDHHDHSHDHHDHSHSHSNDNHYKKNHIMHGMFLHVLADTLGSVGVILSSLCIRYFQWNWADPLVSIFIAVMILFTTWPLLKSSGEILLQRSPPDLDHLIPIALQEVFIFVLFCILIMIK